MQFFVDSADLAEIESIKELGCLDGVTTNPSLMAKQGIHSLNAMKKRIADITKLCEGFVSAEVIATDVENMFNEAMELSQIAPNVCVKLPLTEQGLKVCRRLSNQRIPTNVTLCFSAGQALMAAKSGATFVSPFIGRLDDLGLSGGDLIASIRQLYQRYSALNTQILAASIRHPLHVVQAAQLGADVATVPAKILFALLKHPLTESGLKQFLDDWHQIKA